MQHTCMHMCTTKYTHTHTDSQSVLLPIIKFALMTRCRVYGTIGNVMFLMIGLCDHSSDNGKNMCLLHGCATAAHTHPPTSHRHRQTRMQLQ